MYFMEPLSSLLRSQHPATGTYLEPDESNQHPKSSFPKINFNTIPLSLQVVSSDQACQQKFCEHSSSSPCTVHAPTHLILLDCTTLTVFGEEYKLHNS